MEQEEFRRAAARGQRAARDVGVPRLPVPRLADPAAKEEAVRLRGRARTLVFLIHDEGRLLGKKEGLVGDGEG